MSKIEQLPRSKLSAAILKLADLLSILHFTPTLNQVGWGCRGSDEKHSSHFENYDRDQIWRMRLPPSCLSINRSNYHTIWIILTNFYPNVTCRIGAQLSAQKCKLGETQSDCAVILNLVEQLQFLYDLTHTGQRRFDYCKSDLKRNLVLWGMHIHEEVFTFHQLVCIRTS